MLHTPCMHIRNISPERPSTHATHLACIAAVQSLHHDRSRRKAREQQCCPPRFRAASTSTGAFTVSAITPASSAWRHPEVAWLRTMWQ
eukprot:351085-Chlamydomonas_euryale.AAC.3